jgi:hypothetical protein
MKGIPQDLVRRTGTRPKTAKRLLRLFPDYGYWKELLVLLLDGNGKRRSTCHISHCKPLVAAAFLGWV